jgi:hypothetical protein
MANLKFGNTNIGKISIIEPPETPIVEVAEPSTTWTRPSHWLDLPAINSGEHKAAFLWAVPSGDGLVSNYTALGARGIQNPNTTNSNYRLTDFTIDWGDGNTEHFNTYYGNGVTYGRHHYDFSAIPSGTEFEYRGMKFRQVVMTIDGGDSGIYELSPPFINSSGSARQSPAFPILDFDINMPSAEYVGVSHDTYDRIQPMLEKARLYAPEVRYLNSYFKQTPRLKSVDITTGSKLLMTNDMFSNCGIDYLPDFETSGVKSCHSMFYGVKNIKVYPSGKYDFSQVYYNPSNTRYRGFDSMFAYTNFEEIHIDIPLGGSATGTQSMSHMFNSSSNLKKVTGNWNTLHNRSTYYLFSDCFNLTTTPKIDFTYTTDTRRTYINCGKIQGLSDVTVNMPYACHTEYMYSNSNLRGTLRIQDLGSSGCQGGYKRSTFTGTKIKKLEVSATLHTTHSYGFGGMFSSNALLEYADCIDVSGSSRVDSMFAYCYNLKTIGGINAPKSNNFSKLFYFCYNLKSVPYIDITCEGTGNVSISDMFHSCRSLQQPPQLDLSRVYYASNCFSGIGGADGYVLDELNFSNNLSSLNTSYAAGRYSFSNLREIKNLTIPPDANLNSTFSGSTNLKSVPFVEASGAYTLAGLFNNCKNLEVGTLSGVTSDIGYYRTALSREAIVDIFNWLGTANKTIDIRYTPGSYLLDANDIAIATSKGWTVTT